MKFDLMLLKEKQESPSPLPVLPRLDRLDRLLHYLEEKHALSERHNPDHVVPKIKASPEEDPTCKAISSALEEVNKKGTLMDRIEMLEDRVIQLSLEMDEKNTSKSSSSTSQVVEKTEHDSNSSSTTRLDTVDVTSSTLCQEQDPFEIRKDENENAVVCLSTAKSCSNANRGRPRKVVPGMYYRKWIGCFHIRC